MKIVLKRYRLVIAILIALLCLCLQYFRLSGRYGKPIPVLETSPNNCYDKTLRVLARPYYNPYTFYDSDNTPTGHDVELINIIANELQMNLELRLTDWNSAIEAVKDGEADVLMACEFFNMHSPESELAKTICTVYDEFAVFGKKPLEKTVQLLDKRIGILKNGNVSSDLYSMGLAGKCTGYSSYFAAFQALMDGECEYVIGRTAVGIAILDTLGAKDIKPFMSVGSSSMCLGLSQDNKELLDRIDAILMKLKTDGTLERLHAKWLTTFVQPYTFQDVMRNNPWMPLTTVALFVLLAYVSVKWHWERLADEQRHRAELKEQNRKLEKARDMAQAANNAKTAFLFNMS
ncbi:MAG: transporter substrate-binding domain-containing protein, partial [Victivallales bacterium]|nr:transporter substrate-binding domain-containing protein [Victivallales bacterium]